MAAGDEGLAPQRAPLRRADRAQQGRDDRQASAPSRCKIWRRSFDVPPPPLEPDSPYRVRDDRRYAGIDIPHTESLKDTIARVLPYYDAAIVPRLRGRRAGDRRRRTAIRSARSKSICRRSPTPISSAWKSRPASQSSTNSATIFRCSTAIISASAERQSPPKPKPRLSLGTSPGRLARARHRGNRRVRPMSRRSRPTRASACRQR